MGTILASAIQAKLAADTFDEGFDRFVSADHLSWFNEFHKLAAILKPDSNPSNAAQALVAGTKQSITGVAFHKAIRNMGVSPGTTPGAPVYQVDMDQFSRRNRNWHTATANATVQCYMYDPEDPKNFYVYPPQPSSGFGYLEIIKYTVATDIAAITSAISLSDEYEPCYYHYGMYKAHMEDAKYSALSLQKAMTHINQVYMLLGRMDLVEWKTSRKVTKEARPE